MMQLIGQDYNIEVRHFGVEDGLLQRETGPIFEDKQGFIWIGSAKGLQRFDGTSFKTWTKADRTGHIHDIVSIFQDADGWLWLHNKAQDKIIFLHPLTEKILTVEERFGNSYPINDFIFYSYSQWVFNADSQSRLCFLAKDPHRVIYYDIVNGFDVKPFTAPVNAHIRLEFIDDQDHIWMTQISPGPGFGPIWDILNPEGIVVASIDTREEIDVSQFPLEVRSIIKSSLHKVHTPNKPESYNSTLKWNLTNLGWEIYQSDTMSNPVIVLERKNYDKALFNYPDLEDSKGRIWISGEWGLNMLTVKKNLFNTFFSFASESDRPFNNSARGILEDSNSLFVNFELGGLVKFNIDDPLQWSIVDDHPKGKYTGRPIIKAFEEGIFTGHDFYEMRHLSPVDGGYKSIKFQEDLPRNAYVHWSYYKSEEGRLWVGMNGGLAYMDPHSSHLTYAFPNLDVYRFYNESEIVDITPSIDENLWISGQGYLYLFDPNSLKYIDRYGRAEQHPYHLPASDFHDMYIDDDKIHWVATNEGLIRWDIGTNEKQIFTSNDGLSSNIIYSIIEDDHDCLWLSSQHGIMRFEKESFQVQSFYQGDGVSQNEFNKASSYKSVDGHIYFGGLNGVTSFHPEDFHNIENVEASNIYITGYEIFDGRQKKLLNKEVELRQDNVIDFYPTDRFFRLEFVLINYDDAKDNTYAWKVEGVDDIWHYQEANFLQIGNLPFGSHILSIKGKDNYGRWSKNNLEIIVNVHKPFYLQTWFILSLLLGLVGSVYLYNRLRAAKYQENQKYLQDEIEKATTQIEEQASELRELDKVKSRFFTNVSHELRTPLTLMIGPLKHLLDNNPDPSQEEMLSVAHRNAHRQLLLVNQLLDLAKIDAGKMKISVSQEDIVPLIKGIVYSYLSLTDNKNISISVSVCVNVLLLHFDRDKMEKIFFNLISNAIKFTPPEGDITVQINRTDEDAVITISDTGIGIDEERIIHIFDRFYQVESAKNIIQEGSGIGLAFVKELVELHKGSIRIESKKAEGTTVILSFPLGSDHYTTDELKPIQNANPNDRSSESFLIAMSVEQEEHNINAVSTAQSAQPRLLIIEDNDDVRTYISQVLDLSYNLNQAKDGVEGIQKAVEHIPDLIICDVMMPGKDGYEVCHYLKNDIRTSHIPVILLTAKAAREEKLEGLQSGADDYLTKPFDAQELKVRIRNLIELRKNLRSKFSTTVQIKPSEVSANTIDQEFMEKALLIVEQHMANEDFNIEVMTKEMGMSATQLNRKLRSLIDQSTLQFIKSARLHRAADLLTHDNRTVAEIAFQTGFRSAAYFAAAFKTSFGVSPSIYRANHSES